MVEGNEKAIAGVDHEGVGVKKKIMNFQMNFAFGFM